MALSAPNTPKTAFITPRRTLTASIRAQNSSTPHRLGPQSTDTPDCFHPVQLETPKQRRPSKEKHPNDEVTNLTVAVRIRPMNKRELAIVDAKNVASVHDQDLIIRQQGVVCTDHVFHYDHVLWSCDESSPIHANQEDVFLTIGKPLLNNAFRGYNACLFAYGQTGSGKSFSMMGRTVDNEIDIDSDQYSGITPRFCRELFARLEKLRNCSATVEVSYFEIYNEKIHDLLSDHNGQMPRVALKVREHPAWGPYVVDLSVHTVKTYKELRDWLEIGNKNRSTAATNMNEKSSRSHSIFSIELSLSDDDAVDDGVTINSNCRRSKVSLVDLAGSERLGNSHNSDEKIKEGVCINKSLLMLGKVISSLADHKNNHFIPYRDSVLTWLLRESLGGNSLTSMLATITPSNSHIEETLSTLRYACRARSIVNRARINENPHDRLIRELRSEVTRLRSLRQDYERNSFTISNIDEQHSMELDELKMKLNETEMKLKHAEHSWEQRFMESKQEQLKVEKLRAELESKVRIMNNIENNVSLSPFRTNFLQELEGVLTENDLKNEQIDIIYDWCKKNHLNCHLNGDDTLVIVDELNKRQCFILLTHLERVKQYENIGDFINSLTWTTNNSKILKKSDILMKMNEIYTTLKYLQPNDNENHLCLLYAKVNKSLQSFETALLKNSSQKTVTFNM